MCRFVCYQGAPVALADLVYRPRHSLLHQSMRAEQMSQSFNADGFGIGFYTGDDPAPCIVRSTAPAWSNRGIESIARRFRSTHVFAHVRAASPGMPVQETNCHPFGRERYQFMHNGHLESFARFKRTLQNSLSDAAWGAIEGSTDSEHAFALFLDAIAREAPDESGDALANALAATVRQLAAFNAACGAPGTMVCNLAASDGRSTAVVRFSRNVARPATLYYSAGERYELAADDGDMLPAAGTANGAVIVASEPVTRRAEDWCELPNHTLILVRPDHSIALRPLAAGAAQL